MSSIFGDGIKILIVDDDELSNDSLRMLLMEILSNKAEISSLNTGNMVIQSIVKNRFDIVFLDNKLPDKSGLSILREIKEKNIDTNIIFITGFSDEQLAVKAMKLGARDYIAKGNMDVNRLLEAINDIVLDKCSVVEIDAETLSEIQSIFSYSDEIKPHNLIEVKYDSKIDFDKNILNSLDIMYNNKYIDKKKLFSIAVCPKCGSNPKESYLTCPVCDSTDIVKGEVIEHNKCHHIDFKSNFIDSDGNFECPKCGEVLKQIGVDYLRIGTNYKCSNSHIFPYPEHKYICVECDVEFKENEANLKGVYKYSMLENGKSRLFICDSILDQEQINAENVNSIYEYK